MIDSEAGMEVPNTEPIEKAPVVTFEDIKRQITERMDHYRDELNSYDREVISLIMDVLDKARLTLHDLTDEQLAELDALEAQLFRKYLPQDYEHKAGNAKPDEDKDEDDNDDNDDENKEIR